jgi:hypothetical protein
MPGIRKWSSRDLRGINLREQIGISFVASQSSSLATGENEELTRSFKALGFTSIFFGDEVAHVVAELCVFCIERKKHIDDQFRIERAKIFSYVWILVCLFECLHDVNYTSCSGATCGVTDRFFVLRDLPEQGFIPVRIKEKSAD